MARMGSLTKVAEGRSVEDHRALERSTIAFPTRSRDPHELTLYGGRLSNRGPSVCADQRGSKPRLRPAQINLP